MIMLKENYEATMKEQKKMIKEQKDIIKGRENDMILARQCCNHLGFYCYDKDCKNYCCPLHIKYNRLKWKK